MRTFVVPDLHGRYSLALGLLQTAEIVDEGGVRDYFKDNILVVQLGDLANCAAQDRYSDLRLLEAAASWFDVLLVGNHEHPYFGGPAFSGFWKMSEVQEAVYALDWQAALAVGNTLLTHAGVTPDLAALLGDVNADAAAKTLNERWEASPKDSFFSAIGQARGGCAPTGGILWSDFLKEPRSMSWNQVHGHTPLGDKGPIKKEHENGRWTLNLDTGGKWGDRIVGAWLNEDGDIEQLLEYPSTNGSQQEEVT